MPLELEGDVLVEEELLVGVEVLWPVWLVLGCELLVPVDVPPEPELVDVVPVW